MKLATRKKLSSNEQIDDWLESFAWIVAVVVLVAVSIG